MSNSIIPFSELQQIGRAMAKSGYFTDARDEAQAIVKVLAGNEIGIGPFASMTGIHVIQGKPVLGANLIAALIKNDPRYNYRVTEHTDKVCAITFFENGVVIGDSRITLDELKRAGSKNLDKFPKNMLFARAISNGAKWHTPGIFGGAPIYTPDEFGMDVDEDGDAVIEAEARPSATVTREQAQNGNQVLDLSKPGGHMTVTKKAERPWSAEVVRDALVKSAAQHDEASRVPTAGQEKMLVPNLESLFPGDDLATDKRRAITEYVFGATSTKDLTPGQALALIRWCNYAKDDAGEWVPDFHAIHEGQAIYTEHMKASGQADMWDNIPEVMSPSEISHPDAA